MNDDIPLKLRNKKRRGPLKVEIVSRATWQDRAISYGAGIIAILSFALSIWQGWIGRQHNKLSVRPVITISEEFIGSDADGLSIANSGAGVAFIEKVYIYVDGKLMGEMNQDWWARAKATGGITQSMPVHYNWLLPGAIVETGPSKALLITLKDNRLDPDYASRQPFERFVKKRLAFQIAYTSLYEEHWRLKYAEGRTTTDQGKAGTNAFKD